MINAEGFHGWFPDTCYAQVTNPIVVANDVFTIMEGYIEDPEHTRRLVELYYANCVKCYDRAILILQGQNDLELDISGLTLMERASLEAHLEVMKDAKLELQSAGQPSEGPDVGTDQRNLSESNFSATSGPWRPE